MYLSEFKTSLVSFNDVQQHFIKLNFISNAKPDAIYNNSYVSKKYNDLALKMSLNLNHYLQLENITEKKNVVFSYIELNSVLNFIQNFVQNVNTTTQALYTPDKPEFYPSLMFVYEPEYQLIQIWVRGNETFLLCRFSFNDFALLYDWMQQIKNSFVTSSMINSNLYMSGLMSNNVTPSKQSQAKSPFENNNLPVDSSSANEPVLQKSSSSTNEETSTIVEDQTFSSELGNNLMNELASEKDVGELPDWMK